MSDAQFNVSFSFVLFRTALSNSGRSIIMDNLKDGEALVTLDFGMKILPTKSM